MYFRNFITISPWKRVGALYFNKLESPSPKDTLCQDWLKLAKWFWRRRFLKFVNVFFAILSLSPLEKGAGSFIGTNLNPFTQEWFVPSLVEIGPVVLEKKLKMWKVYDNNDDNDDGQRTNFYQKSSLESMAQVS